MVEAYHQMAEGKFRAETAVTLAESDKAGDEPVVLNQLHPGISLTVSDLLALMIAFSDNTATNLLVRRVGAANVDRRMRTYGLPNTKIFRPTFCDGHADVFPEEEKEFGLGMTMPNEIARLRHRHLRPACQGQEPDGGQPGARHRREDVEDRVRLFQRGPLASRVTGRRTKISLSSLRASLSS
jgi:beta-lactamase class A